MVFSYSQAAAPAADTPAIISIASPAATIASLAPTDHVEQPSAGPSNSRGTQGNLKHLILDAGPLLSLTPLRHLADEYHTTPAVLAELRDPKAREYWDRLGLSGVDVKVEQPSGEAMARALAFAKKSGDYAVLSQTDLGVIALTLQYEMKENGAENVRFEPGQKKAPVAKVGQVAVEGGDGTAAAEEEGVETEAGDEVNEEAEADLEAEPDVEANLEAEPNVEAELEAEPDFEAELEAEPDVETDLEAEPEPDSRLEATNCSKVDDIAETLGETSLQGQAPPGSATEPPSADADDDDPESAGEWITPSNLSAHRSKDLGLLPSTSPNAAQAVLAAACMTGDFAVQNVLLGMGLGLVGEGGKRIAKVKSWVLRCHACFKICRDPSKKFCPTCGGPTLMRTNVTTTANGKMHLHLKSNFQYNLRGTKFTIPDAKPGRAKGQLKGGTGLILREDQREWQDAVRLEEGRQRKEEKKMAKGWDDPDWLPEILTVGMSGKGRSGGSQMPAIGHGRKNPNVARRKR